jgi:hypothetical protein
MSNTTKPQMIYEHIPIFDIVSIVNEYSKKNPLRKINKRIEAFEYKSWDNVNYLLCDNGTIDPEDGYNLSPSYIRKKERKRRS